MSLVEELQREALDPNVRVGDLLRKALVVATKLKLEEFRQWCALELDGYRRVDVPEYRKTKGEVYVNSSHFGSNPMVFREPEMAELVTLHKERAPVGPLNELLAKGGSDVLIMAFPPAILNLLLLELPDFAGVPQLHLNKGYVRMIIETVRNTILNWSLKLEKEGILGQGMSFSPEEKKIAAQDAKELQPPISITIHHMQDSVIQSDSSGSTIEIKRG